MRNVIYTEKAKQLIRYFAGYGIDYYEIVNKDTMICDEVYGNLDKVSERVTELNKAGGNYCFNRVNN
jgi:hypothetical protein